MLFGWVITTTTLLATGLVAFALTALQMLVGYRKVRFKGKTHMLVHKRVAWALLGLGMIHGLLGVVYVLGIRIG